ncbi:MAG: PHP domain-containing protein [Thermoplasmatota archaeon]
MATNAEVAAAFEELADLLEIEGANPFRVRAYRTAARVLGAFEHPVGKWAAEGRLRDIPGIGEDLAAKIGEVVATGHLAYLEEKRESVPAGLREMLAVEGLGPKRVRRLREELGVSDLAGLEKAARAGRVAALKGFGKLIQERVLKSVARVGRRPHRILLSDADVVAAEFVEKLAPATVVPAGSLRRRRETVGDIDLVAGAQGEAARALLRKFAQWPGAEVLASGRTRETIRLASGLQVDLRVVEPASLGAALLYFTGSKAHNVALRRRAVGLGMKLSEYGLERGGRVVAGKTEASLYRALGLQQVPPELREDQGEIEAAERRALPKLVGKGDLVGDLHCHSDASDGKDSVADLAKAAGQSGLQYLAVTDHSPRTTIARGLPEPAMQRHLTRIRRESRASVAAGGPEILAGAEVDILPGGKLDYPNALLEKMDVVVASLHHRSNLEDRDLEAATLGAMENVRVHILGHATGRLIGRREGMGFDVERLLEAAANQGWGVECNGQPDRLDLGEASLRVAKRLAVPVALSSDAHSTAQLAFRSRALDQARRAGLEAPDVMTAWPLQKLRRWLEARGP